MNKEKITALKSGNAHRAGGVIDRFMLIHEIENHGQMGSTPAQFDEQHERAVDEMCADMASFN